MKMTMLLPISLSNNQKSQLHQNAARLARHAVRVANKLRYFKPTKFYACILKLIM